MSANGTPKVENLYHVVFSTSHLSKLEDVNDSVEKVRICGTYTTLGAAKGAAHRLLFESGYQREWFVEYDTNQDDFVTHGIKRRAGLAVFAKAKDGTIFRIGLATTPNVHALRDDEDHKIHRPLYHVVQTSVLYSEDDSGEARETNIQGSYLKYEDARELAGKVLLNPENGVTKESFEQYDEADPGQTDCGYGENVVVHAIGANGENFLVSVLRGQEIESVRLAEASLRIRAFN